MKKAFKVNLGGIIFHIDEDAYEMLKNYLKVIESYFIDQEGGKEIVDDIEARMAELFQVRTDALKQVITIGHVNEVIEIMGDPGDFIGVVEDDEGKPSARKDEKKYSGRGRRRLYRDPDNSVFGGVCGGLGAFFGIDPLLLRILFVILLIAGYGVWGLVYIILWIAVPKAVTISQKLEMRGEPVTVTNIEKTIKDEYESVTASFKKFEKTEGYGRTSSAVEEILQVVGRIFVVLAKVVVVLVGAVFVFAGFFALIAFLGMLLFNFTITPELLNIDVTPVGRLLSAFIDPANLNIILTALLFAVSIPLIAIIYAGVKLLFNLKTGGRGIGIAVLIIWIISVSVLFTMGIVESRKVAFRGSTSETVAIDTLPGNILYLRLNERVGMGRLKEITWFDHPGLYEDPQRQGFYSRPSLRVRYAEVDVPELILEKRARGSSPFQAELNAEMIGYRWEQVDSLLVFDNLFALEPGRFWKFEELNLRLVLPEDMDIDIGDRMDRIIPRGEIRRLNERNSK